MFSTVGIRFFFFLKKPIFYVKKGKAKNGDKPQAKWEICWVNFLYSWLIKGEEPGLAGSRH